MKQVKEEVKVVQSEGAAQGSHLVKTRNSNAQGAQFQYHSIPLSVPSYIKPRQA